MAAPKRASGALLFLGDAMTSLKDRIKEDMKSAMRAKDWSVSAPFDMLAASRRKSTNASLLTIRRSQSSKG